VDFYEKARNPSRKESGLGRLVEGNWVLGQARGCGDGEGSPEWRTRSVL